MKKIMLAGALSIACFTGGFGGQAYAQEAVDVASIIHPKQAVAATNQLQAMSYQDVYKMLLLSKIGFENNEVTIVTTKNSITVKVSLEAILQSYKDGTNLYPEGEKEFKENYEEFKKIFGNAIQIKITQTGNGFKSEIYTAGKWEAVSAEDLNGMIMVFGRADVELKPGGYFKDAIGHWAESYIQLLYQTDIINGTTATSFNPNGQVTRGELAAIIFRASGLNVNEDYEGPASYTDLNGFWGAKEVAILEEYGLIDIFDGDKFQPKKPVTREEMAYITARYLTAMEVDLSQVSKNNTFTDKNQMRKETVEAIGLLQHLGILNGTNGKFNPKGYLTRAEVSKILTMTLLLLSEEA
ncbi:S-layer homology domain-containing protein [Lysinibacillus irui]|uniref:S-layer homology domain-containing protein n=1 Tax=Lysinibacillus irui TaxID=2998077 RepID=A0ABU5NIV5_9BACI|nr:S-layer homology domain-containing protein [Lysinibacillus irui]MEA0553527.1 S-layer homology domain-containing protein [Lysinibacillus irui]MEA0975911.1 S-layer homology domain-containing protein [Lysinibacillus irui]MEA1042065.1 S-layer homology domain-containing protein [Lysinibacillus irui]